MLDAVLLFSAGLLVGAGIVWGLLRYLAEQQARHIRTQCQLELAIQAARGDTLECQNIELRERLCSAEQGYEQASQLLSETQQKLAAALNQVQYIPTLEHTVQERERYIMQLNDKLQAQAAERATLNTQLANERQQHAEKLALLTEARETLTNQFKALASDILEEKTQRFTEQNRDHLGVLLGPLHQRMQDFSRLIQETYDKDSKERLTLEQELKRLQELNSRLNQDAVALTQALTGGNNKTQGIWGEMVLEKVLESSGLQRGREYCVQVSDTRANEEDITQRFQPDVVIYLPDNKQLVVDAKVTLNAYVRYAAAQDDKVREVELKAHIAALRQHMKRLSEKRYQDLYQLTTLDFVFLFIPVEPAYLLAVQHDMQFFYEAFEKRIMIVGPSTLLATLRTVSSIWRYEYQNQNAQEIARQGGALYDKFVGFVETMEKLGRQLEQSRAMHQEAMRKLSSGSGNLLGRAQKLRELGVKSNKQMPTSLALAEDNEIN